MILDVATLIAYFDRTERAHWSVAGEIELAATYEELVVSPFVVADLRPIAVERYGAVGWHSILDELGGGAWTIPPADLDELRIVD